MTKEKIRALMQKENLNSAQKGANFLLDGVSGGVNSVYESIKKDATSIETILNKNIVRLKLVAALAPKLNNVYTLTFNLKNVVRLVKATAKFTGIDKKIKNIFLSIKNNALIYK